MAARIQILVAAAIALGVGLLAFWANSARLRQEREASRLERLQAALERTAERLAEVNSMEDPFEGDLDRSLSHLDGELSGGQLQLRLWFDDDHPVVKAWEDAARGIVAVKKAWWDLQRDGQSEEDSAVLVNAWAAAAREELRRRDDDVPSLWRTMIGRQPANAALRQKP